MDILYPNLNRRVKAALIDTIIFVILFMTVVPFLGQADITPNSLRLFLILLPFFIIEPFLVATTGGSVGHHLMKIKVRKINTEKNIGIISAVVRFILKSFFGLLSLLFILSTRKHQAFHDKFVNSIVVFKNQDLVPSGEGLKEQVYEEEGYIYPSKSYRFFIFFLYAILSCFIFGHFTSLLISDECLNNNLCGPFEYSILVTVSIFWLLVIIYLFVKSMRAELFGCRKKTAKPDSA